MARRFSSGGEFATLSEYSATSGTTPTIVSGAGVARTGTYALQCSATANTSFARYHDSATDRSVMGHQFLGFKVLVMPGAATTIVRFANSINDPCAQVRITVAGKLQLWNSSGAQVGSDSVAALSVDGIHHEIELRCDSTTSPGAIALWLDGTLVASGANDIQAPWSRIVAGIIGTAVTATFLIDDWKLNDDSGSSQTGRCGNGKLVYLRPAGDGDNHAWANTGNTAGSATNCQLVDELSPNSATDYVQSGTLAAKDYYTLDSASVAGIGSGDTINLVAIMLQLRNNTADATLAMKAGFKCSTGGTIGQGAAIVFNGASFTLNSPNEPRTPAATFYADPAGGSITQAKLLTSQAGIEITTAGTNRFQVSALGLIVDYTPSSSTPITSSDTASAAEASTLAAAISSADTGAAAETATLTAAETSAETGTGLEAATLAAALTGSETAAGLEAAALTAAITAPDVASAADAASLTASITDPETATAAEASSLVAASSSADTATGTETAVLVVQIFDADTGNAAEASTIVAALASTDTATTTDQATDRTLTAGEDGTAAEASALSAALASSETAAGADAATPSASLTSSETAAALENSVLAAQLTSGETATGGEGSTVDDGSGSHTDVVSADTALALEASTLAAGIVSADSATAVETATVTVQINATDTGTAQDTAALTASLASTDTGSALDATSALTASLIAAETAQVTEANMLLVALAAADTGTAMDAQHVDNGEIDPLPPVTALITVAGHLDAAMTPVGRLNATLTPTSGLSAIVTRGE